ncbi:NADH-quinone oxidoreductase subunit L [Paenibacillus turpanensis]|uniref:NADH-quinone oxidoreductase subunit L n=1 Tax=Paenibacillus turpanensis TaxID=2689078 RepID=UPI00140C2818|nr:NADH-quinone oxidoreductase subunit L [Paenibacillus turpanensis]
MSSVYSQYAWLVPMFPLLAYLILTAMGRQLRQAGAFVGILASFGAFVLSVLIFMERLGGAQDYTWNGWRWIEIGEFAVNMGFEINNLNALMLVVVTLVSFLVNLYSKGYMAEDDRMTVFFSYIALFTFSMLGLVISVNLFMLFIFWELVGVCSFLLVGFWYFKPEARAAAKKAFIVTRIGDLGLFIALLMLFVYMPGHALDFSSIHNAFSGGAIGGSIATTIALLIFVGAIGKSGQFPLHTWLPDAMEGPTPISALIHAATMVAAGVYLIARTHSVFVASEDALRVVAYLGAFTAIFAATIAIAQNDIKRILAYSTVSQLGYMVMALGLGTEAGYTGGVFHLATHAFFKALLFLGAGSVIHAVHEQDIRKMGGVGRHMKVTAWTFAIGMLALSGIVPLSGFWSKDTILSAALEVNPLLFWVGLITALFTAFYMARLFFLVFTGKPRSDMHPHESPAVMTVPLLVLAVLAVVAGFAYTPMNPWFGEWLTGVHGGEKVHWDVILLSTAVGLGGLALGYLLYGRKSGADEAFEGGAPGLYRVLNRKYYIDELYQAVIVAPLRGLGALLELFDRYVVDGVVKLASGLMFGIGRAGARVQNGQVQTYGLLMLLGFLVFVVVFVGRRLF